MNEICCAEIRCADVCCSWSCACRFTSSGCLDLGCGSVYSYRDGLQVFELQVFELQVLKVSRFYRWSRGHFVKMTYRTPGLVICVSFGKTQIGQMVTWPELYRIEVTFVKPPAPGLCTSGFSSDLGAKAFNRLSFGRRTFLREILNHDGYSRDTGPIIYQQQAAKSA